MNKNDCVDAAIRELYDARVSLLRGKNCLNQEVWSLTKISEARCIFDRLQDIVIEISELEEKIDRL